MKTLRGHVPVAALFAPLFPAQERGVTRRFQHSGLKQVLRVWRAPESPAQRLPGPRATTVRLVFSARVRT